MVGLPVIAILQDVSTDGRYIGQALIVWTYPMTTMSLIMGPKMWAVRRAQLNGGRESSTHQRGSSQGVRVTGLTDSKATSRASESATTAPKQLSHENSPEIDEKRVQMVTLE